jgi:hypothetical protein
LLESYRKVNGGFTLKSNILFGSLRISSEEIEFGLDELSGPFFLARFYKNLLPIFQETEEPEHRGIDPILGLLADRVRCPSPAQVMAAIPRPS